jgi:SAM-dependent methyltransferase
MPAGMHSGTARTPLESAPVDPDWRQQIVETYERSLKRHGPTVRALRWVSEESQATRFSVLAEVGPLAGASLLDIGCGLGDLYGFLRERGLECDYTGYDITPGMLEAARSKYPGARFELRDILGEGLGGSFDYVVASGTFNVRVPDHEGWLARMLETMYAGCRRAVAFNILRPLPPEKQPPEPFATWAREFYYEVEPPDLIEACRRVTAAVEMREGYLPAEYTLYLRREGG